MLERTRKIGVAFGALAALGVSVASFGGLPDDCADREVINNGDTNHTTNGATTDGPPVNGDGSPAEGDCNDFGDPQIHNDVWYNYTADFDGTLTVSTCDQVDYDSKLAVYDGCACPVDNNRLVGCNDDGPGCGAFTSELTVSVTSGTCYKVRVGGFGDGDTGSGTLTLTKGVEKNDCPWDFNGNGIVGPEDLAKLLDNWGPCAPAGDCEGQVCGGYTFDCDPDNPNCVCYTLFDGTGFCGIGTACGAVCPDGNCPPGFLCVADTCCGPTTCLPATVECELNPAAPQVFEPFQMTTLGQADKNGIVHYGGGIAGGGAKCAIDVDQPLNTICMAFFSQNDLAQSFIAEQPNSCGAGFELYEDQPPTVATYTIELWTTLPPDGGVMLASGSANAIGTSVDVEWDSVAIEPGKTYFLVFKSDEAGPITCLGGDLTDPYKGGHLWANPGFDPFPFFDFAFRHYGKDVPPPPPPPCPWDVTGDGVVGPADLAKLLDNWGPCDDGGMKSVCEVGFVCGGPLIGCEGSCVCFSLFDGGLFCSNAQACGDACNGGECPPGFVCLVDTCCGPTVCAPEDSSCEPLADLVFEPFQMTTIGQADKNGRVHPQH